MTHHNLAAEVGSPVDLGTVVEVDSLAAGEGLAGMLPAVGRTVHYLEGVIAGNVSNDKKSNAGRETFNIACQIFPALIKKKNQLPLGTAAVPMHLK